MSNIADYDKKIEDLKKQIKNLEEKKQREIDEKAKSLPMFLARKLHEKCCHHNHIDGCGWFYEEESKDYTGFAHQMWLERANAILAITKERISVDEIIEIADIIN